MRLIWLGVNHLGAARALMQSAHPMTSDIDHAPVNGAMCLADAIVRIYRP